MSVNHQQESQRSRSKKKGISLSLTPSKPQSTIEVSSFQLSRCTVRQINGLPIVQSSNSKNYNQVQFTYQSPHPFSLSSNQQTIDQNEIKWPQAVSSSGLKNAVSTDLKNVVNSGLKNDDHYTKSDQRHLYTTAFDAQRKSPQHKKFQKEQIRSSVFTVVEQISSKIKSISTHPQPQHTNVNENNENHKTRQLSIQKSNAKITPTKREPVIEIQKDLYVIPQKTLETSHQLYNTSINEKTNETRVLSPSKVVTNRNSTEKGSQNKTRIQRLKLAQQKLMNIINVCDYGL